ncbi:Rab protein geranylgeranyltransferase component A 1 [Taenia crassiceps]|uniref:Rab protein geranylgeranyltransferase component A 1 n=1 Tax=Taenia crassiceps TaxID=6207 RepID=A0ABR4Q5D3_9CEST
MDFPNDVDCVVIGTGLTESMIAASLAIVGVSVLHLDSHDYYGGYMTSFRFPDLLKELNKWSIYSMGNGGGLERSSPTELNLTVLSNPMIRNCSFNFLVPDTVEPMAQTSVDTQAHPAETLSTTEGVTEISIVRDSSPPGLERVHPPPTASNMSPPSTDTPTPIWTKNALVEGLRRADFDVLPRLIFAESPLVQALIRSDVTRYLEFRSVNRILFFNPDGIDDRDAPTIAAAPSRSSEPSCLRSHSNPPLLVKVPVSRGEVFQTRILSLTQKRMLVSFLEWCTAITAPDSTESAGNGVNSVVRSFDFSLDPDDEVYLDRPLVEYLQSKRNLDVFISRVVVNCLALADNSITLRNALPRFGRLIASMNRVGPFPLLWPLFGCGELPQSFCRMCAVFLGTYCLGRTVTAVRRILNNHDRRYRLSLSTGEEVSTSCLLIGAEQAPSDWLTPQISRWIARSILVTAGSLFPSGHEPHDITLMPIPLPTLNPTEPAFVLEIPVEKSNEKVELFVVHLTAFCDSCVDAAEIFASSINLLFSTDTEAPGKPRILWNCFFTLPDLSKVACRTLGRDYGLGEEGVFVVPGLDASVFMDKAVSEAATIFYDVFSLVRRGATPTESVSQVGETAAAVSAALVSLEQHWDGAFPPQPPRPEELVFVAEQTPASAITTDPSSATITAATLDTPTPTSARPNVAPSGHGDWSVDTLDNTVGESDFTTALDP